MKNTKLYPLLILIFLTMFALSCSDDKEEQAPVPISNIVTHAEILGIFEVQNSQSSAIGNGDIWNIKVKNMNNDCSKLKPYTFTSGAISINEVLYTIERTDDENVYNVSTAEGSTTVTFSLVKTSKECGDAEEEEEEEKIITKEEIIGIYKVVDAYSYQSGDEAVQNTALLNNIWDIQDATININCATEPMEYSYAENSITADNVAYQVEKEEGKLLITYLVENTITTVHLQTTTETCPEEEEEEEGDGPVVGTVLVDKMYGYAEAAGTTGGEGGVVHHFDNGTLFRDWLQLREKAKSKEPAVVWLSGTFTKEDGRDSGSPWFDIKDTDNLTILGTNDFRMKNVGLFMVRANNIIIRNLYIEMPKADAGADGLSMQKSSKIWIDHCTFESINQSYDYEDGSCDITHGTSGVTVSWNRFIQTQKTALVGHSNSETGDVSITATFHHNYFEKSSSRHPRVRFGKVHVYNNFYEGVTTYGAGSAYGAMVLVEGNSFDGVRLPTDICTFPAKQSGNNWVSNLQGSEAGYLYESHNLYANKPSNAAETYPLVNLEYKAYGGEKLTTTLTRTDFLPPYEYITTKPEGVNVLVKENAGVGILKDFSQAPIEVNNGGLISDPEEPEEPEVPGEDGEEIGNGWTAINLGEEDAQGKFAIGTDGAITLTASGKFEGAKQAFYYIHREVEGDFIATLRVDDYVSIKESNQALAGLLFTPDLTQIGSEFIHALAAKGGKTGEYNYSHRILAGTSAKRGSINAPTGSGEAYVKLERRGEEYYASYSLDGGVTYGSERKDTITGLPNKLFIGLVMSSGDSTATTTGTFSDLKINGLSISFKD